jgi:hypothetical protein
LRIDVEWYRFSLEDMGARTMNNLASAEKKRFVNLIEAVAADHARSEPSISRLGPSVADDKQAPSSPSVTILGPSVGDDGQGSDLRLKEDVHCIGTTVFGLPLYQFKYVGQPETYEGVMAH